MGMGLQSAYGLANVREELKQRLLAQIAEQERQRKGGLDERRMKLEEGEFKQRGDLLAQQQAERKAKLDADIAARREDDAAKAAPQIGMGQNISPEAYDASFKGTGSESLFVPQMSLPARPTMGVTNLEREPVTAPSAPLPQMKTGRLVMTGTAGQQEAERKKSLGSELLDNPALTPFQRIQMQAETAGLKAPTAEPKPSTQLYPVGPQGVLTPHDEAIGKPAYHAPRADPGEKLTKVEHRDENGRTVVEYLPQSEIRGKTFQKGVGATAESRLQSAQAVNQTGTDIIAKLNDPAYKAAIGPEMGRYSTLRDFIGNPPPEFSELAGAIESYSLANMGVHGMRSAQGAEKIKTLLDQHHTPESLIAAIQGLNKFSEHFMQNEGRGTTGAGPNAGAPQAPPGWKYVRGPGGRGWTAVEDKKP